MLKPRPSPKRSRLHRNRRGAAAALFLVMTVALLGVMAVTIDVTRLMAIRAELQTAADAAALAGVIELLNDGGDSSRDTAIAYAARHPERISHLILWCTYARGSDFLRSTQAQAIRGLVVQSWELYTETVAHALLGWSAGAPARQFAAMMGIELDTPMEGSDGTGQIRLELDDD